MRNMYAAIVGNLLQQLVTEHTDRLHRLVQSTPPSRLQSFYRPSPANSVLTWAGSQQVSTKYGFDRLVTECTDQLPASQPLLYSASPNRLQSLPT